MSDLVDLDKEKTPASAPPSISETKYDHETDLIDRFKHESLVEIVKIIGVKSLDDLCNTKIKIEILHDPKILDKFRSLIPVLKKIYSSDKLTCLHSNSGIKQKHPGINFLRQILKVNGYDLKSKSVYKGYQYEDKKYYRYYYVSKIKILSKNPK